jgi:hypothetical protein
MTRRFFASLLPMLAIAIYFAALTPQSAKAEVRVFVANLSAANEVPPVSNAESGVTGTATITLDVTRDASNNITAATARFDVQLAGFPSSTVVILSHIHEGAAGVNGPVRVDSGITPGSPIVLSDVGGNYSRSNLTVPPAIAAAIIANPAGFYFNVHSAANPNGVARGQLSAAAINAASAPTLSQWGAILMTLLIVGACVYFIVGRGKAAFAGGMVVSTSNAPAIDWQLFAKVALGVETLIAIVLLVFRAGAVDIGGALASGLLAAFILHLLIGAARRR